MKTNSPSVHERGLQGFLARHGCDVTGVLHGFDRVRFQGCLRPLYQPDGMSTFLQRAGVLRKDFREYVRTITGRIRTGARRWAEQAGRPQQYLASSSVSKEELVRQIVLRDGVREGPVVLLSAVEPCRTWVAQAVHATRRLELKLLPGKCTHLYFYFLHPQIGLMHLRLQTWFPFLTQVCLNGREWLGRQMIAAGLKFLRADNCFTAIEDVAAAQALMDAQFNTDWQALLDGVVQTCHPVHQQLVAPMGLSYYWTAAQSEYASDLMFAHRSKLARLYPHLLRYGLEHLGSADVLRFLGHGEPAPQRFKGEASSDLKRRVDGIRLKHRRDGNSLKIYDKHGQVLRVETTINQPESFKVYRTRENEPEGPKAWRSLRRGVADLHRRGEVCRAVNERYLEALTAAPADLTLAELLTPLCKPVRRHGRRQRGLRPLAPEDLRLLKVISQGDWLLEGFRNRDVRALLFPAPTSNKTLLARRSSATTRRLAFLRAHGLIRKIRSSHRYQITSKGRRATNALFTACSLPLDQLERIAA